VTGPGKRLVTVLVTLAVPAEADAEDAAGLVADAAVSTALEVVSAAWGGRPSASTGQSGRPPRRGSALAGEGGVEEHRNPDRLERHAGAVAAGQAGPGPTGRNR